jgi:hypothetical protein
MGICTKRDEDKRACKGHISEHENMFDIFIAFAKNRSI